MERNSFRGSICTHTEKKPNLFYHFLFIYIYIKCISWDWKWISSSSLCRVASTDIPDHLSPLSPYQSSPPAGLQGYILCLHIAAVCKFELVVLFLHGHMWGSLGVHHFTPALCRHWMYSPKLLFYIFLCKTSLIVVPLSLYLSLSIYIYIYMCVCVCVCVCVCERERENRRERESWHVSCLDTELKE